MAQEEMERLLVELNNAVNNRFYGKYRGIVKENKDDENLGRIRALVPEVLGDVLSGWALPCTPYTGNGSGQLTIPAKESGVWVEFEAGDVSRPIWTGGWWAAEELPKDNAGNTDVPDLKIIRSEKGLMVTMNDGSQTITVSDTDGKNVLEIKVQDGQITIKGAIKAVVEAPKIELVENSTHPVVFGDKLLQYLNQLVQLYQTHLHPGELAIGILPVTPAPPVPPFPPPTPDLLSTKVTSG
jgi:Type VI secretion system/phage-baseplate injector OB domain